MILNAFYAALVAVPALYFGLTFLLQALRAGDRLSPYADGWDKFEAVFVELLDVTIAAALIAGGTYGVLTLLS